MMVILMVFGAMMMMMMGLRGEDVGGGDSTDVRLCFSGIMTKR